MTRFFLIRHATNDTVGKLLSGRRPGLHLNEEGVEQSKQLAERLKDIQFDTIVSSPMERAIETAQPVADRHNLKIEIEDELTDIDFGEWTWQSFKTLDPDPDFQRFNSFRSHSEIPGGETMPAAQLRIVSVIRKLQKQYPSGTVAVFSHADLIKSAIAFYAGIHLDMFYRLQVSPTSVNIIELDHDSAKIVLLNHAGKIENSH